MRDKGRRRVRVISLLVIYALFVVLSGAHGLMHGHACDLAAAAPLSESSVIDSGGGRSYEHSHHDHHTDGCSVCQLFNSSKPFQQPFPLLQTLSPETGGALLTLSGVRMRVSIDLRSARGPPAHPDDADSFFVA